MAISTQQAKIPGIGFPVAEAVPPRCGFATHLGGRVNVVDIEGAEVVKSTFDALTAERLDQFKLSPPVPRVFVNFRAVLVPIRLLTFWRAVAHSARCAALLARTISGPSVRQVASLAAVFAASFADSVRVHFCGFAAALARNRYGCCSHSGNVARKPKYFDIACRRISEALRQPDMFIEKPKPTEQARLEL